MFLKPHFRRVFWTIFHVPIIRVSKPVNLPPYFYPYVQEEIPTASNYTNRDLRDSQDKKKNIFRCNHLGCPPIPVTVTTRTITIFTSFCRRYLLPLPSSHYWQGGKPKQHPKNHPNHLGHLQLFRIRLLHCGCSARNLAYVLEDEFWKFVISWILKKKQGRKSWLFTTVGKLKAILPYSAMYHIGFCST